MKRIFTFIRLSLLILGVVLVAEVQAQVYNSLERFTLIEDKIKTHEMLNPYTHDFLIELGGAISLDSLDLIDEAEEAQNSISFDAADALVTKYDKTEHNARINFVLGAPLPSFSAFGVKFKPNFRVNGGVGFIAGLQGERFDIQNIANFLPPNLPPQVEAQLQSMINDFIAGNPVVNPGDDIVLSMRATPTYAGLSAFDQGVVDSLFPVNEFFAPENEDIVIDTYIKAEAKAGLYFNYKYGKHFYGAFNLYGLGRADLQRRRTSQALENGGGDIFDLGDELNTTINAVIDYKLGYKNKYFKTELSIEEIKLAEISDREEVAGELTYGNDPLYRWHSAYTYRFTNFKVRAFGGVHYRSAYDFSDGLYAGADFGFYLMEDRIGVRARGMLDKEYFTLSPLVKLWFMHAEYMLKVPVKSENEGVKPATIHALNLRFFF